MNWINKEHFLINYHNLGDKSNASVFCQLKSSQIRHEIYLTAFILSSIGFEALSILYSEASLCLVFVNVSLASAALSVHYTANDGSINRLFVAGGEYKFLPKPKD